MSNVWPWPLKHIRTSPCVMGFSVCVAPKHGLVIVTDSLAQKLLMYSLRDGSLVRGVRIREKDESSNVDYCRTSVGPDGSSLLLPEIDCLREVNIGDGLLMRYIGKDVLKNVQHLDCNTDVIVTSEWCIHRVCVFSYRTGYLLAMCGGAGVGPGRLDFPGAIRLSSNGREMVVYDRENDRLSVFSTSGQIMSTQEVIRKHGYTKDFLLCPTGFVTVQQRKLLRWSAAGKVDGVYELYDDPMDSIALAALPDGGLIVRRRARFEVLHGLDLRINWMAACACLLRR